MKRTLRNWTIAAATGAGLMLAAAGPAVSEGAREATARELILEATTISRAPQMYADIRVLIRDALLPILRDAASGKLKGLPPQSPVTGEAFVKFLAFMENVSRASDELDAALVANREALITDSAQLFAKHSSDAQLSFMRDALKLNATRRYFDALYAISRIYTGYNYDELRSAQEFAMWTQQFVLNFISNPAEMQTPDKAPPPERIAKAKAIVDEFMATARIDDMQADILRFAREVVLKVVPDEYREALRAQIDISEVKVTSQKQMILIIAPIALATVMNEKELEELRVHMRSASMLKFFKIIYDAERAITAFTVEDLQAGRTFIETAAAKGDLKPHTEDEKKAFEAELDALGKKWKEKLENAITPSTRDALIRTYHEFDDLMTSKKKPDADAKPL